MVSVPRSFAGTPPVRVEACRLPPRRVRGGVTRRPQRKCIDRTPDRTGALDSGAARGKWFYGTRA
eukprot:3103120-Pyramimonas_sp.AAC.1